MKATKKKKSKFIAKTSAEMRELEQAAWKQWLKGTRKK